MSGGIAYVLDEHRDLYLRINKELVSMDPVSDPQDAAELRALIQAHAEATGSPRAKAILAEFEGYLPRFKKILPRDYDRMLHAIAAYEAQGMGREEAEMAAFYASQTSRTPT